MPPKALFVLARHSYDQIYGPRERADIDAMADVYAPPLTKEEAAANPEILEPCELIFSGWGAPRMDAGFLEAAPHLRAVFYGAGSVKGMVSDALWERGITVTSSWGANALPVAEYTLSQVLFCLKLGWRFAFSIKREGRYPSPKWPVPGTYGSTVAVISLGMIGRRVCELLRPFDLQRIAFDPFVEPAAAAALGVRLCSLEECFATADVVSLHTPRLPETEGMIRGEHFRSMRPDASFLNTARGAVVRQDEMIEVLSQRPDITAVLDVTYPEPPPPNSPLYTLPNVIVTPHIAGSMGAECLRMGRYAVEECRRFLAGEPLHWQVTRERAATLA
ncbi:MAG: hydroxyacid dehydrogenase [Lentisphaeria bacterium]|nr:hydroxyacid dehydrogenase [Lentisphaeria bacterium]